jgi:hypothetical protein
MVEDELRWTNVSWTDLGEPRWTLVTETVPP